MSSNCVWSEVVFGSNGTRAVPRNGGGEAEGEREGGGKNGAERGEPEGPAGVGVLKVNFFACSSFFRRSFHFFNLSQIALANFVLSRS